MRLQGYCTECHKIKVVQVSSAGMVRIASGGVASGICAQCQEDRDNNWGVRRMPSRNPIQTFRTRQAAEIWMQGHHQHESNVLVQRVHGHWRDVES